MPKCDFNKVAKARRAASETQQIFFIIFATTITSPSCKIYVEFLLKNTSQRLLSQPAITCSKLTIDTLEQGQIVR